MIKLLQITCLVLVYLVAVNVYGSGIVGDWGFDEGTGNTIYDSTVNNNDGTINGALWINGKIGKALRFYGENDYVDCGNDSSLNITGDITVTAWIKPAEIQVSNATVLSKGGKYKIRLSSNMVYCGSHTGIAYGTPFSYSNDEWLHIAWSFSAATGYIKTYKNGVLQTPVYSGGSIESTTEPLIIGADTATTRHFNGLIDKVNIYDQELSENEVYQDYQKSINCGMWRFEDGTGTTASDSSFNLNNGTLNNMGVSPWVSGKVGQALDFDGVDDYVDCGNDISLDMGVSDFSVEAWIKTDDVGNYGWVMAKGQSHNINVFGIRKASDDKIHFRIYDAAGDGVDVESDSVINDGKWHHIVGVAERSGIATLYVDGVLQSDYESITNVDSIDYGASNLRIGVHPSSNLQYFNGMIDEVRIHRRNLNGSEIRTHYKEEAISGKWHFEEGTGTTASDSSLNVNDATLNNMDTNSCWVTGKGYDGGALEFDGIDDYVDCGNGASLNMGAGDFSVEAWIKTDDIGNYGWVLGKGESYNKNLFGIRKASDNKIHFRIYDAAGDGIDIESDSVVNDGKWHHIVGVADRSGSATLYVDGVLQTDYENLINVDNIDYNANNLRIGVHPGSSLQYFNGTIDEVKIHRRILSENEISQYYYEELLTSDWSFEDGTGTMALDFSIYANDGALNNMDGSNCWVIGKGVIGKALEFDGVDDYVDCGNGASLNMGIGDFSLEAWIRTDDIGNYGWIIAKGQSHNINVFGIRKASDNKIHFRIYDAAGDGVDIESNSVINDGKWHHIVGVANRNGSATLYLDGVLQSDYESLINVDSIDYSANNLRIGIHPSSSLQYFDGTIDEVRIHRRVLSGNEINQYYNQDKQDYDHEFDYKLTLTSDYEQNIPQDTIQGTNTTSSILIYQGVPTLHIKGSPEYGMKMMPCPWDTNNDIFNSCRDFAAAGVNLYSEIVFTWNTSAGCSNWWTGAGQYNWSIVDSRMQAIINANPLALILVRIKLNAPQWWLNANPNEHSKYIDNGTLIDAGHESLASTAWKSLYEGMLRDFIRHLEASSYNDHIYGYHIAGGGASEWFWWGYNNGYIDYGTAALSGFRNWLEAKYGTDAALKTAWNDSAVTLASAEIPTPSQREDSEYFIFRNPNDAMSVLDYRHFLSDTVADNIINACRIVKEETNSNKIAGAFYGYSIFNLNVLKNSGWQGLKKVLASSYIDFLSSPTDYKKRKGGEEGNFISSYTASYQLHNKLYWDEADIRTHFYDKNEFGRTENLAETIAVLQRAFGYSLVKGTSLWWFLLVDNAGFHQKDIMEAIAEMKQTGDANVNVDKTPVREVAILIDEESLHYLSDGKDIFMQNLIEECINAASRMGAPFDVYLLDDISDQNFPDYKLYIFLNSFYTNSTQRNNIQQKIRKNNAVAVWLYASGFITDSGFSETTMAELTGITIKHECIQTKDWLKITDFNHAITKYSGDNTSKYNVGPLFWVEDQNVQILGCNNAGKASLVVKEFLSPSWRSVYCAMPLTKELLRGLCDYAEVHLYSTTGDVIYANKSFVMIHTTKEGYKKISLPDYYDVYELLTNTVIGENINEFSEELPFGATRIYKLLSP